MASTAHLDSAHAVDTVTHCLQRHWVTIIRPKYSTFRSEVMARRVKVHGTGRLCHIPGKATKTSLGIDRQYYSCCIESREMKEDKYRAERLELVSI